MKLMVDHRLRTAFARHAQQNAQRFNIEQTALRWKSVFESCTKN